MTSRRNTVGLLLAAVGGGALAFDLFNTWYTFRLPAEALNDVNQASQKFGDFGGLIRAGADVLSHTTLEITAWNALSNLHLVLMGLALGAIVLAWMSYNDRVRNGGGLIMVVGAGACILVLYRVIMPPGPIFDGTNLLHVAPGAWIGLAAAAAILIGGVLDSSSTRGLEAPAAPSGGWTLAPTPGTPPGVPPAPVSGSPQTAMGFVPPQAHPGTAPGSPGAPAGSTGWTPPEFFS